MPQQVSSHVWWESNTVVVKCPVCDGTGKVSRPPWVSGDVETWTDSNVGSYTCHACEGRGYIIPDCPA